MATIRTHRTLYGEDLADIANQYYGDPAMAVYLYQHNEQVIRNINHLDPGTVITIPYVLTQRRDDD